MASESRSDARRPCANVCPAVCPAAAAVAAAAAAAAAGSTAKGRASRVEMRIEVRGGFMHAGTQKSRAVRGIPWFVLGKGTVPDASPSIVNGCAITAMTQRTRRFKWNGVRGFIVSNETHFKIHSLLFLICLSKRRSFISIHIPDLSNLFVGQAIHRQNRCNFAGRR